MSSCMQVAVLPRSESGHDRKVELVPLNSLNFQQRTQILDMALKTKDMDNELFLRKVRSRLDRCSPPPVSKKQIPLHTCFCSQVLLERTSSQNISAGWA